MKIEIKKHISCLIDADVNQLMAMLSSCEKNSEAHFYIRLMMAYYFNDETKLNRIQDDIKTFISKNKYYQTISDLVDFRIAMIKSEVTDEKIKQLENSINSTQLDGDVYFCLAIGHAQNDRHDKAKKYFLKAYNSLIDSGVRKKSLVAMMNTITAEGNIDIRKRLISSYHKYSNVCLEQGASVSAANALFNISDEMYKVGAFRSAYKYIEKALDVLSDQVGTKQYYEALSHKCELLFALDNKVKANKLLSELNSCHNSEILEALKVIRNKYLNSNDIIDVEKLSPPWKTKYELYKEITPLGELGDILIDSLSKSPVGIEELVEKLYLNIDYHDAKNRLTTLVTRTNKKHDSLILFDKDMQEYRLSFNELVDFKSPKEVEKKSIEKIEYKLNVSLTLSEILDSIGKYSNEFYFNELAVLVEEAKKSHDSQLIAKALYNLALEYKRSNHLDLANSSFNEALSYADKKLDKNLYNLIEKNCSKKIVNVKLGEREKVLYEALLDGTRSRQDLILLVYGEDCDYEASEKSFKSLLYRFKKKVPGQVSISTEGLYVLELT